MISGQRLAAHFLLHPLPQGVVGVARRTAAIDGGHPVPGVPLVGVRPSARAIRRQVARCVLGEPARTDLVGRGVKGPIRAGAVGLLVRNARHVGVAVVGERQVMSRRARGHRGGQAIHVVIRKAGRLAEGGVVCIRKRPLLAASVGRDSYNQRPKPFTFPAPGPQPNVASIGGEERR